MLLCVMWVGEIKLKHIIMIGSSQEVSSHQEWVMDHPLQVQQLDDYSFQLGDTSGKRSVSKQ